MRMRMEEIEQFTNDYIKTSAKNISSASSVTAATITIPVVVHVVYNTTAQNVSESMIMAQIDALNKDYSATNSEKSQIPSAFASLVANTNIQFCLAKRDPSGNAATGIVRKSTTVTSFVDDDKVKSAATGGDNPWDATKYLNLWVCNLGNGLLGYAQFPGGPATTDGVVILYSSLPGGTSAPYNKGRTATHEIGHWLNLRHTWGDESCGSDLVTDTPTSQTSNFGCPVFPHVTCSNGPNGDLFQNYMDYTDDACMYMFTNGQSTRMNAIFATGGVRASIATSNGCVPPSTACGTPSNISATSISSTGATLTWSALTGATKYNIQYKLSTVSTWTTVTSTTNSKVLTGLTAGKTYNYQIQAVCTSAGAYSSASSFTTTTTACGIPAGLTSASITAAGATLSWNAVGGAVSYNIQYKVSTATAWTTTTSTTTTKALTGLLASTKYSFQVQAVCSATSVYSSIASFTTLAASSTCTDSYEPNNTQTAAASIPVNTEIKAMIGTGTDVDWFKFSNTSASPNFKITLTNLPKDFDLQLYNVAGTLLLTSDNAGTTAEGIVYNSAPVGTYYVKVLGYGGITSTSCYTLKAQTSNTAVREIESSESKSAYRKGENVAIFPNPSPGNFSVKYISDGSNKIIITVYDLSGNIIRANTMETTEGENIMNFNLPEASNGLYIIGVNDGLVSTMYKIMIKK
ncbi:MAG: hypothetical protein JWN78_942 [Bacteroidota bacterium]|nr:hypothetical protein [Bacteroidota bacterium]